MANFTAYVFYPFDPAARALDIDGLMECAERGEGGVEEIDFESENLDSAWRDVHPILEEEYEEGGIVIHIAERYPGIIYL